MNKDENLFDSNANLAVIVPVHNIAAYIRQCLDSLLAQTYPHWVAYVIDDGSTDGSSQIVDEYAIRDSRFRVFHKPNGGIGSARNFALEKIVSEPQDFFAVTFLDGDDWLSPDAYSDLMRKMLSEDIDILFFGYKRAFPNKSIEWAFNRFKGKVDRTIYIEAAFSYGDWLNKNGSWGVVWNKIFRKEVIAGLRFIEDRMMNEDEIFCVQAALKAESFYFVNKSYYFYRQREGSLIRAPGFDAKIERGRLLILSFLEASAVAEKTVLQKYTKSEMLRTFLNASKKGFWQFFTDDRIFARVAEVVLPIAAEQHRQGNISDIDYRLVSVMASFNKSDAFQKKLIVSMTSYPARISSVSQVLGTIFNQTLPPDEIVVWLGRDRFSNQLADLPEDLKDLAKNGKVIIRWVQDLGPHTKYFYAFKAYPDSLLITIDDDVYYPQDMIENLYRSYLLFPRAVSALRARLIYLSDEGEFSPFNDWFIVDGTDTDCPLESMQFLAEGVGGCLYPTGLFSNVNAFLDAGVIQRICPNNDDLWLKAMALIAGVPVAVAGRTEEINNVPDTQKAGLWHYNLKEGGTDYEWSLILREMDCRYGKGTVVNKLLEPSIGENFLVRDNLHRLLIGQLNKFEKVVQKVNRVYAKYITLRVDIRNKGENNNVIEQSVVPNASRLVRPSWLPNGVCVESRAGRMKMVLRCQGTGELDIRLRGRDERNVNRERYPVWIDCMYFAVNGEAVFDETKTICHDRPYVYRKPVVDGEVVELEFHWSECRSPMVLEENKRLSADVANLKKAVEKQTKRLSSTSSHMQGFRIGAYLKYKVLSKLTFGGMRARYRRKYQEQKRIYRAIRKGDR